MNKRDNTNQASGETGTHNGRSFGLATKIQQQLRKDDIRPPKWPQNPGSSSQRAAMEKFREAYKVYRDKATKSMIRAGLFDDPDKRRNLNEATDFRGISDQMCPEWEKITRITEYDIRKPEKGLDENGDLVAQTNLMVKRHARSAAGQEAELPMDVRSFATVRRTLDYMIDELVHTEPDLCIRHNFVWDRTRGLRKDLGLQKFNLTSDERDDNIYTLETIARFHATALHLLSREEIRPEDFSVQQEVEQLGKTLISLKELYEDCLADGIECENEAEFLGYLVLLNAHEPQIRSQVEGWGTRIWNQDGMRTAMCLVESIQNTLDAHGPLAPTAPSELALNIGSMFFSIIESPQISYTMACIAEVQFNRVRRSMAKVLVNAYSRGKHTPKDLTPAFLQERFHFDSEEEAIDYFGKQGFQFEGGDGNRYMVVRKSQPFLDAHIPHPSSHRLVERKRCGRTLPVLYRQTVYEEGHSDIQNPWGDPTDEDDSLFVDGTGNTSSLGASGSPAYGGESLAFDTTPETSPQTISSTSTPTTANQALYPESKGNKIFDGASDGALAGMKNIETSGSRSVSVGGTPITSSWTTPSPSITTTAAQEDKMTQPSVLDTTAPSSSTPHQNPPTSILGQSNGEFTPPALGSSPFNIPHDAANIFKSINSSPLSVDSAASAAGSNPMTKKATIGENLFGQPTPSNESNKDSTTSNPHHVNQPPTAILPKTDPNGTSSSSMALPIPTMASTAVSPLSQSAFSSSSVVPAPTTATAATISSPSITGSEAPFTNTSQPASHNKPVQEVNFQSQPQQDVMSHFTEWFVCADKGLMEDQLLEQALTEVLADTWTSFAESEAVRKEEEEEENLLAEARKFREQSLKVTFFYRWLDLSRKHRVVRRIKMNKEIARQWKLPENVAKREAAARAEKEKELREAKELFDQRSRTNKSKVSELRASSQSRRHSDAQSVEEALLASGVLHGVHDEAAAARYVAGYDKTDTEPGEAGLLPGESLRLHGENQRRRRRGLPPLKRFPEPKVYKEGSKTAMLRALSKGAGRDSLSMSTGSLRNSTFSSSYRSSLGFNSSRVAKPRTKVTDPYWRMKANGLVQMPNGEYLHESLALPMIHEGKRFPGVGDFGLGPGTLDSPEPSKSRSPPVSKVVEPIRRSTSVGGTRFRQSRSSSIAESIGGKRKRRAIDADLAAYRSETPANHKRVRSGTSVSTTGGDDDVLASIANLMKDVSGSLARSAKS
ncbi:SAC3/GANP/Nin1/mts3/eIF-3 p25 family-domain-containing protein [Xylariaceae sp. FL0016]|nr:SAC3/GANP/Nin1/mts3/eIF-3 p25 family-domain-containing protein [Xylariaceae sp. FL0016]